MPSATAATNDANARARLTVEANGVQGGITWSASVTDNNANFGGFGNAGSWTVTVAGQTVAFVASAGYDFGANSPPQYFPRSESGTVTGLAAGTYTVTGTFRGNVGSTVVGTATIASFSVTVPAPTTPVWSTAATLTAATQGTAYSRTVTASPVTSYTNVDQSANTRGLSASGNVISGTPSSTGTVTFTIRANNTISGSTSSADRTFSITINLPPPVFSDSSVASPARLYNFYSDAVVASNSPTYSVFSGALPTGITLNPSTGAITGTPTVTGSFSFVIRATNSGGTANTPTLTIRAKAGLTLWNGSNFVFADNKIWNGTSFIPSVVSVWNGSAWRTPEENFYTNYLVVAGGGGAGEDDAGGGGAGGVRCTVGETGGGGSLESSILLVTDTNYTVTIGAGGSGATVNTAKGTNGANSVFATITSIGGGGGAGRGTVEATTAAGSGGSGGGGNGRGTFLTGGAGTANQGFAGGTVPSGGLGGGGGGAGGAGGSGISGVGITTSITGSPLAVGGGGGAGGGGGPFTNAFGGGTGVASGTAHTAGTVNTGGGGGASGDAQDGRAGGSGLVVLRYPNTYTITIGAGLTGSTATVGLDKVTTITAGTGNISFA